MASHRHCSRLAALLWGVVALLAVNLRTAQAKERVEDFLDGLRRSGMYDVAEEYLESLKANPNVSDEIKQTIPFELGKTVISKAESISDVDTRLKELAKARTWFEDFLAKSPTNAQAPEAESQIGAVSVSRGKAMMEMSRNPRNSKKKVALLADARAEFLKAQQINDAIEKRLDAAYTKLKADIAAGAEGGPPRQWRWPIPPPTPSVCTWSTGPWRP